MSENITRPGAQKYDFETLVKRRPSNMKLAVTDEVVLKAGNVSFDGAEPDYKTAPAIRRAVIELANNGLYGFTMCDDAYRGALVWWMQHSRNVEIHPEWVVPTLGTMYSLATTIRLCVTEGDSMIVLNPMYNRFEQAATRLERNTEHCELRIVNGRYELDFDALERLMAKRETKLLAFCNPHNPTGRIWAHDELCKIAELSNKYDVTVFCDEIFADNCYGGRRCPCYLEISGAARHGIVATSLGKAFHFTGVNHCNILIADDELRTRFTDRRTRDHFGSIDPLVYESVLAAYSPEGLDWLHAANDYCERNIRRIKEFFAQYLPAVSVYGGEGGYLLWMDWRDMFSSESELMDFLVNRAYFHLDAGSNYGAPGFTRMCIASPAHCIEHALGTLKAALENI